MANTRENQEQREGKDVLTAAQILLDQLSRPVSDPTLPQTTSTPSVFFSSIQQAFDDGKMSSTTYSEGSNQLPTITGTAETTITSSARFDTSFPSHSVFQNTGGFENSSQKQTGIIGAAEAAQILLNLHRDHISLARIPVDLLSIAGRSGLRSRGVFIRRQGAIPVDERLSTEQDIGEEDEAVEEEDTNEQEEEFDDEDDEEYQAAARRARRPAISKITRDRQREGKTQRKSRRKNPHGAPGDYQRHSVRDGKGRFIRRSE